MQYLEFAATLAGYIAGIITAVVAIRKLFQEQARAREEQAKIREGQKCQLRSAMLRTYHDHRDEKRLRQYEAENFVMMYQAYKAMGGNSFIDEIYEHVTKWDVET